jgi:hypothetical protein
VQAGLRTQAAYYFFYPLSGEHKAVMLVTLRVCNAKTNSRSQEERPVHFHHLETGALARIPGADVTKVSTGGDVSSCPAIDYYEIGRFR